MSYDGEPPFAYHVFDLIRDDWSFVDRQKALRIFLDNLVPNMPIRLVPQVRVASVEELEVQEEYFLKQGYEGLIGRSPGAKYKFNRSTLREGGMLKLKRFKDSEAFIEGAEERMANHNEAEIDARGFQVRSSSKEGKVGTGMLGKWVCFDPTYAWTFKCTGNMSHEQLKAYWEHREEFKGKKITYKFLPHGSQDAPRHPIFKAFRHSDDMDPVDAEDTN